jgi:phenylacetate-CoA oxygenase PaaJ subunit
VVTGSQHVWKALERVSDPEYPLSLVDMGMIYDVRVQDRAAHIDMTFTSIGCPAIEMIKEDIRAAVLELGDIDTVEIEVVWSPPWTRDRISPAGRRVLAAHGVVN